MMETICTPKMKIWMFYLVASCFFLKFAAKSERL